ncbi:helix-turn-helix domain-containing protein [Streptomyces atacamensis]|uniref:helix-turn-helix domain-containing protein n=1 Tax=Streptomyces atacamensis TaxID=531966 RepID=UPI00399D1EB5
MARNPMTADDVLALPAAVDIPTAGRALNLGRTLAYDLAKRGEFPCKVLRIGNAYRVRRADLLDLLGIEQATPARAA